MKHRIAFAPTRPENGLKLEDYWVWDPSVIRDDNGVYHLFASRWPRSRPFHPNWLLHSEVIRATSTTLEGPYTFAEVILPRRGPDYWDGMATHNPKVFRWDGVYYLFYIATTHPLPIPELTAGMGKEIGRVGGTQRIGVAWAPRPEGPWTRSDEPALTVKEGTFYNHMVTNPAPVREEDGSILMVFKSRHRDAEGNISKMMFGVARAKSPLGPYRVCCDEPLFGNESEYHLEDPAIWKQDGRYWMLAKDMEGNLASERWAGALFESSDGMEWKPSVPSAAYGFDIPLQGGSSIRVGALERVFPYFEDGTMRALLGAVTDDQPGGCLNANQSWVMVVPVHSAT